MTTPTEIPPAVILARLTETAGMRSRATPIPQALFEVRVRLADARKAVGDLAGAVKESEAETVMLVAGEVNGEGKPKFTNDTSRKAEVARRLANDAPHQTLVKRLAEADMARVGTEMELARIEDELKVLRLVTDLVVADALLLGLGR